ncbi:MAG: T9SS type A sorting domain-containing protein [Mesonia hippocampi]|uniref:T9SS type A sorting domain-containing protein n=1 Tax=Mesonia hippocampi TaxID=1628250 RepID=UPI003F99E2E5
MKKITLLLLLLVSTFSFAQGTETFDNLTLTGTSYSDGTFTGQDGSTWEYLQSRGDFQISGNAIMLGRNRTPDAEVKSGSIANGIGTLNFDYKQAFSNNVDLDVYVNNVLVANVTTNSEQDVIKNSGNINVNVAGNFVLKFLNTNGAQVVIDNVTWTANGGTPQPALSITAPTDGQIFNPNTTSVNASFNVQNFSVGNTATSDGYISWVLNSTTTAKYDTADETINVSAGNSYTLTAELLDFNGNPLNPAVTQTVNFSVANYTQVATIQALRDLAEDTYAEFTGEATITFLQNFRNQKYIEDATAAILIDDNDDVLTNTYAIGDNITGLKGLVGAHNGIAQFYPVEDIATIVSNGNTITPQTVTIADFMANYNNYESELIAIENVTITGDTNVFTNGSNYTITENTGDSSVLRTNFYNVDFIGTNLPTEEISFVAGIAAHYNGKGQIFPRDLNDFGEVLSTDNIQAQGVSIYPNPANTYVNIQTANNQAVNVAIYNLLGQEVLTQNNVQNTVNLEGLQKGLYIIKVSNAHVNFTQKLIVK